MNRRIFLFSLNAVTLAASVASKPRAVAQALPAKPIRLVVPFPAGGGTDTLARALGQGLTKELGQPVIVDNKPGAGTIVGNDAVAKSPADGTTLLLNTTAIATVPGLSPKLPYPADTAFAPVVLLGRAPSVAVVRADSALKSARDLLAQAKARPGKLTYGSAGNGTSTHLAAELLKVTTQVDVTHVPYRGASPMITDLLGGQIDLAFATLPSVAPFLASGKLRALGVTGSQRSPRLPEVPSFAESGAPGYQADVWYAVFAPAGTPAEAVAQIHGAVRRACETPAFGQRVSDEGLVLSLDGPEATDQIYRSEMVQWRKLIKEQGITME